MGGTIDSRNAPERDGEVVPLQKSLVEAYIRSMTLNFACVIRQICMKDSRGVTDQDRDRLIDAILNENLRHNLVTHGTYTMKKTGMYLHDSGRLNGRVTTLSGSMGTLLGSIDEEGRLVPSDGQFNLGYSMGQIFSVDDGIYQSMNGDMFRFPEEWWIHTEDGIVWRKDGIEHRL